MCVPEASLVQSGPHRWISGAPLPPSLSALLLVHHPESLQELVEVDAAVFVEVDAPCQLIDGSVVHGDAQVGAEQAPGLTELLDGD